MKKYFSINQTDWVLEVKPNEQYLYVDIDRDTLNEVEVIFLHHQDLKEDLPLHSERNEDTETAVEFFKRNLISFMGYVDFFTVDNIHTYHEIQSRYYAKLVNPPVRVFSGGVFNILFNRGILNRYGSSTIIDNKLLIYDKSNIPLVKITKK